MADAGQCMWRGGAMSELLGMTPEEYYADRQFVTRSMLNVLLDDEQGGPETYYGRFVANTIPSPAHTPQQLFGTLVHSLLLEGGDGVVTIPDEVLTKDGRRYGKAWEDFIAANAGKHLAKASEIEAAHRVVNAILDVPRARSILTAWDGSNEVTLTGTHSITGTPIKCRIDRLCNHPMIVDLKVNSRTSPKSFSKAAWNFGYHRQVAFYKMLVAQHLGIPANVEHCSQIPFVFIVASADCSQDVQLVELDGAFEEMGRADVQHGLEILRRCHERENWHTPTYNEIVTVSAPRWSRYREEWEYDA